ncbi:hypothetical protein HPB51_024810 [Rhipicephalus microplus]|uniref:SGNH hydrolase-type esterase domain-containing protein n=1 Tax=Rhipicephalus microplus TaxID=6941 RepID=A0A9J6F9T3_RHIMP|nr:hypothetical protein HPB51_024810 [Rhipicephalus microplus]
MAPRKRSGTGDEGQVQCQECLRWCFLGETMFESVADAKKAPFECRPCERTRQGFDRLEKQMNARVKELEGYLREKEKRGRLSRRKWPSLTRRLVRTVAELDEAREERAQLEKRVEELVTPAAGDDASARAQNNGRHAGGNADPQGVTDAARTSGVRQRRADSGNKEGPEAAPGSGGSPARSLAAVVNHSSPRTPAKVPAKDQRRRQVIVVGDSNMARVGEVIKGRVGDDERVKVSKLPGKRVGEVMQQAKEQLWDRMEDRSLVVVMGGVNDVLQGRGGGFAKQIAKGITELRATSEDVQIAVCTVPEVQKQGVHVERAVVTANRELWTLGKTMKFEVVNLNRNLVHAGRNRAFVSDGIHFSNRIAEHVGHRLAARVVAFLGGGETFKKKAD